MFTTFEGIINDRMRPFRHRSFMAFFFAQGFSLIGTWSHEIARAYLALELGGKAAALGSLMLSTAIPALIFGLHGGVIADRKDAHKILLFSKSFLCLSALILAALTEFGHIQLWMLFIFSFFEGVFNSYDAPAYTATFARLIPKEDFKMAIVLQSANFHLCRMLGPAVAGALMLLHGPSVVFLFDSISYLGVILVLRKINLREMHKSHSTTNGKLVQQFIDGIKYINQRPSLRYKQLQLLLTLSLALPVMGVVFRTYLKTKFGLDGGEFGFLFSLPAFGAMAAAMTFILLNFKDPIVNLKYAIPITVTLMLTLQFANTPLAAGLFLAAGGYFSYMAINSITQSIHFEIEDEYRGRLGSLIAMGFTAVAPLMSYPLSLYTDYYGFQRGIQDPVILYAIGSLLLFLLHRYTANKVTSV